MKKRISTFVLHAAVLLTLVLGFAVVRAEAETYSYDTLGRLTHIAYPDGTAIDYTYDASGNRLALTASTPTGGTGGTGTTTTDGGGGGGGGGGCLIDVLTGQR